MAANDIATNTNEESPKSAGAIAVADREVNRQRIEPVVASAVGEEGEALVELGDGSESNVEKKTAWNKPSNGAGTFEEAGTVIGAGSWPALSESARGNSAKSLSDGLASMSISKGSEISGASQKHLSNSTSAGSTPNNSVPASQRSTRRAPNSSSNDTLPQLPASAGQPVDMQQNNFQSGYHHQRGGPALQSQITTERLQGQRNTFRNRDGSSQTRDGSHQENYGGRHDVERGNRIRNPHRSFSNNRDTHMQQQRAGPRFMRPPQTTLSTGPTPYNPFYAHPPVYSYSPVPFPGPDLAPQVYYFQPAAPDFRPMPFVMPSPTVYFPPVDPALQSKIVKQIEYYFSDDNLVKDTYLRGKMNEFGWVPIDVISRFNKISCLTNDINMILDALQNSAIVEVQGDKVRKRNDWMKWLMPTSFQPPNRTSLQVP